MAAFDKTQLRRFSSNILASGVKVHWLTYATNDTLAELTTDGYFNAARDALTKSSIIFAVADVDGTPNFAIVRVTTWSATGDLVTAIDSPAA